MSLKSLNPKEIYLVIMHLERERLYVSKRLDHVYGYDEYLFLMRFAWINAWFDRLLDERRELYNRSRYSVRVMLSAKRGHTSDRYENNTWFVKHSMSSLELAKKARAQFCKPIDDIPF